MVIGTVNDTAGNASFCPAKNYNLNVYDLWKNNNNYEDKKISETTRKKFGNRGSASFASLSPSPDYLKSPTPSVIRKLKSSLKLSKSHSASSVTTCSSSSSQKNVRFAAELTTVKKFDSNAKPISISNENSPTLLTLKDASDFYYTTAHPDDLYDDDDDSTDDGFWFHELSLLPAMQRINGIKKMGKLKKSKKSSSNFQLDYDSDSGLDEDNNEDCEDKNGREKFGTESKIFDVIDWQLLKSNVCPFKNVRNPFIITTNNNDSNLENQLFGYLQGSNIRLHSLSQSNNEFGKITGLIYVNNLNFEKFIEIKFTFNSWKDIHYISANYHKSITNKIDEFKFTIDLNSLKYSLKVRNLIYSKLNAPTTICPLNVELCCRYDVNNETFYDNNNYENYQMKLTATTRRELEPFATIKVSSPATASSSSSSSVVKTEPEKKKETDANSFAREFLVSTTLSHNHEQLSSSVDSSRRFTEDTDYYNTSPLKHLYHNDTSLIRPVSLNQVLTNPEISTDEEVEEICDENEIIEKIPMLTKDSNDSSSSSFASLSDLCPESSTTSSLSSSSSGYSPLEDFTSDNYDYYPCAPFNSISSMDMAYYNHLPMIPNFDTSMMSSHSIVGDSHNDLYDDRQSIVTDVVGDCHNRNNSTETLINPNAIPRPMSSASTESALSSFSPDQQDPALLASLTTTTASSAIANNHPLTSATLRPKDIDYQAFLSSYCFYNSPKNKHFDHGTIKSTTPSGLPVSAPPTFTNNR